MTIRNGHQVEVRVATRTMPITEVKAGLLGLVTEVGDTGDEIIITDKATATASAGNRELHTMSGTPSVTGTEVTITIAGTLANAYTTANNVQILNPVTIPLAASGKGIWQGSANGTPITANRASVVINATDKYGLTASRDVTISRTYSC
jgi:hypothetical protein